MNTNNNNINKIVNKIKKKKKNNARTRRLMRIIRRNRMRRRRNRIPIASAPNFKRYMSNINVNNTKATVSGHDLVYKIPDTVPITSDAVTIAIIPSNPAYWLGTKISQVARGYQNYRPVKFNVHYVPHCAATQSGNVIAGTVFHEAPPSDNLQQSLRSSNGGIMTQVFKPAVSKVRVGTNLQQNLYRVGGAIDAESMPFYFIALAIACKDVNNNRINPGYFYVEYTYIFKNPIGGGIEFANSGLSKFNDQLTTMKRGNITAVCAEPAITETLTLGVGTTLDIEYDADLQAWNFLYNGTPISAPNTYLWIFSNQQASALNDAQRQAITKQPILYNEKLLNVPETPYAISAGDAIAYVKNNIIQTFLNATNDMQYIAFDPEINELYKIFNAAQDLGKLTTKTDVFLSFTASILQKYLKQSSVQQFRPENLVKNLSEYDQYGKHPIKDSNAVVITLPDEETKRITRDAKLQIQLNEEMEKLKLH